jgi:hypothetical protein
MNMLIQNTINHTGTCLDQRYVFYDWFSGQSSAANAKATETRLSWS